MTKPILTIDRKRILSILALVILFCCCMIVVVRAEEEEGPAGFIFPTLPAAETEEAEEDALEVESVLPGPRSYTLTLNANGSVAELDSTGFQRVDAAEGDTGWITWHRYTQSAGVTEGTVYGLTGLIYTFEKPGEAVSSVMIALPEEPVEGRTYRISAAEPDAGLGFQINDLICCGCVRQTETRIRNWKKSHYDSWYRRTTYTNETDYRKITDCFHYTGALTDAEDYFSVTVKTVHSAYVVLTFEGRLYGGVNKISGEFCCRR
ncbi:MAG: hypothetical protein IKS31_04080 [Clostridia bacterium]|nr:hypothetical protein [Clostridia bacterium]